MIALVLLYGAFISEIYRAALEAIPRGQREAGLALGMSRPRVFVQVILPQATKIAIPNIGQHVHRDGEGHVGVHRSSACSRSSA